MESERQRVEFKKENSLLIKENEELHKKFEQIKQEMVSAKIVFTDIYYIINMLLSFVLLINCSKDGNCIWFKFLQMDF
jgi:hypothetical protein